MSLLSDYRSKRDALRALQEELSKLENDEKLKGELAFEEELRALLNKHGKSVKDVIALFEPAATPAEGGKRKRAGAGKPRALKRYVNPHDGSVVETAGANHATLKLWRVQYGKDVVNSWLQK